MLSLLTERARFAHIPSKAKSLQRRKMDPPYNWNIRVSRTLYKSQSKDFKGETSRRYFSAHTWSYELKIGPINTVCDSVLIGDALECLFDHSSCF